MPEGARDVIIKAGACLVGFFVVFAIVGSGLSHYFFIWMGSASTSAFSETALWAFYVLFGIIMGLLVWWSNPNPIESLIIGILMAIAAGGMFCLGYANVLVVLAVIVVVAIVAFFLKLGPWRVGYLAISIGLCFSLVSFAMSAASISRVKDLSYTSGTGESVTATTWSVMSSTQRESFIAGVIQKEVSRLSVGSVHAYQAILPKNVLATVDTDGSLLVNYAAIRVASPSADQVARYEQTNGTEWVYESLTSPDDLVEGVVHGMAHIYQQQRVAGEVKEQRNWPYDDAEDDKGNNAALEAWSQSLPVDPRSDTQSYDNLLESQAWGYASNRLGAYVD